MLTYALPEQIINPVIPEPVIPEPVIPEYLNLEQHTAKKITVTYLLKPFNLPAKHHLQQNNWFETAVRKLLEYRSIIVGKERTFNFHHEFQYECRASDYVLHDNKKVEDGMQINVDSNTIICMNLHWIGTDIIIYLLN